MSAKLLQPSCKPSQLNATLHKPAPPTKPTKTQDTRPIWSPQPALTLQYIASMTKAISRTGQVIYHIEPLATGDQHGGWLSDALTYVTDTATRLVKPLTNTALNLVKDFSQYPSDVMSIATDFCSLALRTSSLQDLKTKISFFSNSTHIYKAFLAMPDDSLARAIASHSSN